MTTLAEGEFELFVPGRLCLVGEHSDWAGRFRTSNPNITPGHAVIVNLREGLTARVRPAERAFIFDSELAGRAEIHANEVLAVAQGSGIWRYAAGVAHVLYEKYGVQGVDVRITECTLPAGKGFSSSAAVCVLVARAFNRLFNLRLSVDEEMEVACAGERITGSMCGRLDQVVAFGSATISHLIFDGDAVTRKAITRLAGLEPIYIVVSDLGSAKDTSAILTALQRAYPKPENAQHEQLHRALGTANRVTVERASQLIEFGGPIDLGALFCSAQKLFDAAAIPLCPEQLKAPLLHTSLTDQYICDRLVAGGKGVGSQGDGAVQFVARDRASAEELKVLLSERSGTSAHILTIGDDGESESRTAKRIKRQSVTTAIIPAAGFGTRMYPASRSIRPKCLLPIIDTDGQAKPLLLCLVEQCAQAGMARVIIVVGPGDQEARVREVFAPVDEKLWASLKPHQREYSHRISALGRLVSIVKQDEAKGFGDAVAQASPLLEKGQPFAVLLSDVMLLGAPCRPPCLQQCLDVFNSDPQGRSVIGVTHVKPVEATAYGVVVSSPAPMDISGRLNVVQSIVEKPSVSEAEKIGDAQDGEEASPGGVCKIVLGPYILTATVMAELLEDVTAGSKVSGEIQFTPALQRVAQGKEGMMSCTLDGDALDTGNAIVYANTMAKLAVARET